MQEFAFQVVGQVSQQLLREGITRAKHGEIDPMQEFAFQVVGQVSLQLFRECITRAEAWGD
jgi:hypothetical protein